MNKAKGVILVDDFSRMLNEQIGIDVTRTNVSRNILEFNSKKNCLLYVKGRAEQPYRWGVTANIVNRLQDQQKKWYVILLFESCNQGYLLSAKDVEYYIKNVWPLGSDGDYKPASGSYLSRNTALTSMADFIKIIDGE